MKIQGFEEKEIFEKLNISRYCCKRMFISAFDYSKYL